MTLRTFTPWEWLAGLFIAALVGFLFINARPIDEARHTRVITNLSKLQELDSQLDEFVLKLRYGLLHDYDPVVATLERIKLHKRDLEEGDYAIVNRGDRDIDQAMTEFSAALTDKETLIEQFKSRNAVLANSMYYFPPSVAMLSRSPRAPETLRNKAEALLREVLLLRTAASKDDYESVVRRLEPLIEELGKHPPPVGSMLEIVVRHAQNIVTYRQELDQLILRITSAATGHLGLGLTASYNRSFQRDLSRANVYRFLLLLVSLGLLAYAADTFIRLRENAVKLEETLTVQAKEIAKRKRAKQALHESEERYRELFESNPQPMWVFDAETLVFLAVNDAAIEHYGYSLNEFLSMTIKDIRPEEDVADLLEYREKSPVGMSNRGAWRHRKKDGTTIDVEISIHALVFDGRPANVVLASDVTERRRAEEQVRLAANALENTAEGVMISDANRRIVTVNKAFTTITGYAPEEAIGRESDFLRSGEHDQAFYAEVWSVIQETGHWKGEILRRHKSGEIYPEWRSIAAVKDSSGKITHYVSVFNDISQLKQDKARLQFLAHHDALTGLPNRTLFNDRVQEALARAHRHGTLVAVVFVDLDHFKNINDSLGHGVGDMLLQSVTGRLKECVRESDTVARLGGDEFTILLDELRDPQDAAKVADKLLHALTRPFALSGHELFISGSIGVSCYPEDGGDAPTLLKNADVAMYRAKELGRNSYQFFSVEMNAHALEALVMGNHLRLALERNEFLLNYQPLVELCSGRIQAVEALIRWKHPESGLIPPVRFIPIAEDIGLIGPIGEWVLQTACEQMRQWQACGIAPQRMAINLSARQFRQSDLAQRIAAIVERAGLDPSNLELEITESMVMQDPKGAQRTLHELHRMGISVAIDDFGTGHSSLSYLKLFPIDFLKIDRSFVKDIPADLDDVAITRAIIALAHSLNLRVIAEGVETAEQLAFLRAEGCDEGQGYLFSKPRMAEELEPFLREASSLAKTSERV